MIGNEQNYIAAIAVLWWCSVCLCVCVVFPQKLCVFKKCSFQCIGFSLQKPWRWSLSNLEWWCFGSHTASSSFPWTETGRETHLSRDLCASVSGILGGMSWANTGNLFQEKAPKGFVCFFWKTTLRGVFYFFLWRKWRWICWDIFLTLPKFNISGEKKNKKHLGYVY